MTMVEAQNIDHVFALNRPKLRLIDGEEFVELVLENYSRLSPRYRTMIPLKQIYVPDLQG